MKNDWNYIMNWVHISEHCHAILILVSGKSSTDEASVPYEESAVSNKGRSTQYKNSKENPIINYNEKLNEEESSDDYDEPTTKNPTSDKKKSKKKSPRKHSKKHSELNIKKLQRKCITGKYCKK